MSRADDQAYPAGFGDGTGVPGMTIRQAYKIAALNAVLGVDSDGCQFHEGSWDKAAKMAGNIADAMLAEDSAHEAAMSGKGEADAK